VSVDVRGLLVVPWLIDLHTHVYWGGTSLGVAMELVDVIRASTAAPGATLGRTDIGRLEDGAVGDATVLKLAEGEFV
jgi:predicted amidohydrolase